MGEFIYLMLVVVIALLIVFLLVLSQSYSKSSKNYEDPSRLVYPPDAEYEEKMQKERRFQKIWQRLNPKFYLEDSPTEPLPSRKPKKP